MQVINLLNVGYWGSLGCSDFTKFVIRWLKLEFFMRLVGFGFQGLWLIQICKIYDTEMA